MAYVAPPTFTTGAILTAVNLNDLSNDIEFLYGLVQGVNIPFSALVSARNLNSGNNVWYICHQHRYLHFKWGATVAGEGVEGLGIIYNGVEVYTASGPDLAARGKTSYVDLYGSPGGLTAPTVGSYYALYAATVHDEDTNVTIYYLLESDLTSI